MDWTKPKEVLDKYRSQLLAIDQVSGVSTGVHEFGHGPESCIYVFLSSEENDRKKLFEIIPPELDGIKVVVELSGKFYVFEN